MKERVLVCRRLLFGVEVDGTKKKKIDIAYGKKRCVLRSLYYPLFFFSRLADRNSVHKLTPSADRRDTDIIQEFAT